MFNVDDIKKDFPILSTKINGHKLVYLDNGATTQKPLSVINAISNYYLTSNANVHRGVHTLSDKSTQIFEDSKKTITSFFGASGDELIITQNTTQAINGVAYGWGEHNIAKGDVVFVSVLDHHANIVPWQELCKRKSARLVFINIAKNGELDLVDLENKLNKFFSKVKLVALPHVSNVLGSLLDVEVVIKKIKKVNKDIRILIDGAQSAPHLKIWFDKWDIDFFVFSGHKMLAPMGVGGLLVKQKLLQANEMKPWLFGGGMINEVHQDKTIFNLDLSERFIAGTLDVASVLGLATACKYLDSLGMDVVFEYDKELVNYTLKQLNNFKHIKVVGPSKNRVGSVAFIHSKAHAHDVAQVLDSQGIAVRSGHHCAMPLHLANNWLATTRISFAVYNTKEDVDRLIAGLKKVEEILL